jgi:hypothetical protein
MEGSGDVGRGDWNDEVTGWFDFAILAKLRFKEALLLPPFVPGRLDNLRYISWSQLA